MKNALTVNQLSKSYGNVRALSSVSFEVPKGSVFGILGPNGSGKTTLLGIITDVLKADGGNYEWMGEGAAHTKRKSIGTLLETPNFYHYLSAYKNLQIASLVKDCPQVDIDRVLKKMDLLASKHLPFSSFSLGMKQRLAIASALLGDPSIIILDEPTNGLDPAGITCLRQLIKDLQQQGKTIIMASHMLDEVEKICSHTAILHAGKLLHSGRIDELLKDEDVVEISSADLNGLLETIICFPGAIHAFLLNGNVNVFFSKGTARLDLINQYCQDKGILLQNLQIRKKSLETKFLELTADH